MKYPCALQSKSEHDNRIMLAFNKNECQCINSEQMSSYCGFDFDASDRWENITTEYLANTYGEVKSKGHAEFIVKLSGGDSSSIGNSWSQSLKCFVIDSDGKVSFGSRVYYQEKVGKREITIPLPSECESVDEWPKVGDEVQTSDGVGTVKLLPDSKGYYVISIKDEYYQYQLDELSKIKTPEQELRDELVEFIDRNDSVWKGENHYNPVPVTVHEFIADAILSKYNITKKGEGDELQ